MITKPALAEAVAAAQVVLTALRRCARDVGAAGAALDYAISVFTASAPTSIATGDLGTFRACFDAAVAAGATLPTMTAVYVAASSLAPQGKPAVSVLAAAKAFAVIRMASIVTATTFTSRDDVDAATASLAAAFADVESAAGNALQTSLYQKLIALRAAAMAALSDASFPLPQMIDYQVGSTISALTLAQRLYGDAGRAVELARENKVFHPAFMPLAGRALSN